MRKIRSVYTVGQLNAYIKNMFTQDYLLQSLFVKGEVSNCKYHSSGHIYFTLKIKGKDCGTINGHNESSSIRPLMKDAREVLVR